jgi:hypothetical protein
MGRQGNVIGNDAAAEKLLRRSLTGRTDGNPEGVCLDAETAAGWFDDGLSNDERAAVEAHIAECSRCRSLVATMVRVSPPVVPRQHWWQRSPIRWLAPAAAGLATAAAVWIAIDLHPSQQPVVKINPSANAPASPAPRETPPALADRGASETPSGERAPVADKADESSRVRSLAKSARQAAKPAPAESELRERRDKTVAARDVDAAAAPAAKPESKPSEAAGAQTDAVAQRAERFAAVPAAPEPLPRTQMRTAAEGVVAGVAGRPVVEITSPDPSKRWRLETSGTVARSTDGGITWVSQSIGLQTTLTAGMSPAPDVCWIVGRAGVVLLTMDGRTWQRVPFPESVDLRSVVASSAESAVVVTSDNRTFATTDGGRTWTQR